MWLVALVDALPLGWNLSPQADLFVVAGACVWSYAWITRAHSQPVLEVYNAGKDVGRREALLETQCENVRRVGSPDLRVVSNGR